MKSDQRSADNLTHFRARPDILVIGSDSCNFIVLQTSDLFRLLYDQAGTGVCIIMKVDFISLLLTVVYLSEYALAHNNNTGCSHGFVRLYGVCYGYMPNAMTWHDAQSVCKSFGGYLAEPKTMEQDLIIAGMIFQHGGSTVWIGGEDLDDEGDWVWHKSSTHIDQGYTNWAAGEPLYLNKEDCMKVDHTGWSDYNCVYKYPFVCQDDAIPIVG